MAKKAEDSANTVVKEDLETKDNGTAAVNTLHPGAGADGGIQPRSQIMAEIINAAGGIETGDLSKFLDSLKMNTGANQSKGEEGNAQHNKSTIIPHPSAAIGHATTEDVVNIFKDQENMTEEVLKKVTSIFSAGVDARVLVETQRLEEEFDKKLEEHVLKIHDELVEEIDKYTSYLAKEWLTENKVAIDSALKVEITEDFMTGLKDLFKKHYIEVPDNKVDVLEELAKENAELTEKLNIELNKNIDSDKTVTEAKKSAVIEELSIGLSELQKTNLKTLTEGVEFIGDIDKFKTSVITVKETMLKVVPKSTGIITEESAALTPEELKEQGATEKVLDPEMKLYVETIKRQTGK